jgi:protein SCO1
MKHQGVGQKPYSNQARRGASRSFISAPAMEQLCSRGLPIWLSVASLLLLSCVSARAQWTETGPQRNEPPSNTVPVALQDVSIEQRLNEQVPLELEFRDETGQTVKFGDYFGDKPVILSLVYYSCPMLCNQVLNGLTGALTAVKFDLGRDFNVVTVSFDAREKSELGAAKKEKYIEWYKRPGADEGWHFLTGDQQQIDRLSQAVGFRYAYDSRTNQFAHASGIMLLTPQGKVARYFYGIEYAPKDLQLGLVEASESKIGSPVDKLLLYCYHYDPATGRYGPVVVNIVRLGGVATVMGVVALLFILRRRTKTQRIDIYGAQKCDQERFDTDGRVRL